MKFIKHCCLVAAITLLAAGCSKKSEMDIFIDDLMSKMTLEEKLGQFNLPSCPSDVVTGNEKCTNILENIKAGKVGAILNTYGYDNIMTYQKAAVEESRLGIPLLTGLDVIHGHKTVFPIPLGLSCTWNPEAIEEAARLAAMEATADGINWAYNPMVDISRDPRWGRCAESAGEDPYLGSEVAKAMVRGYQGSPEELYDGNERVLACVKHFALYGGAASGLDYTEVDMSPARMYNEYFPPYKAAVEAGVASLMTSFNDVNGQPSTGNEWLLTEVLRNQWGFDGFIVSDYNAVGELVKHRMASDKTDAGIIAYNAGLDMDMVTAGCLRIEEAIKEGKVSMKRIDDACRNILVAKYKLGLFKDPYKHLDPSRAERIYTEQTRAEARKISAESFVLLKNEGVLPLQKKGTVALVGPLADAGEQYPGTWAVASYDAYPSLLDAFKKVDGLKVIHAKGSNILENEELEKIICGKYQFERDSRSEAQMIAEAVAAARRSDIVVAAVGEAGLMSGESVSRTDINLPGCQKRLLEALKKTGKPIVMVLFTGRPLTIAWEAENMDAILNAWFGGSEAGAALTDVLFGDVNPSGKLTMTFPYTLGQVPIYYGQKSCPRPVKPRKTFKRYSSNWLDAPLAPLYPFGYGLSYTDFEYSAPVLSDTLMVGGAPVKASVTVRNTGKYDGYETVQMYIRDVITPNNTRPTKELKGFKKVFIKAGESVTVDFEITPETLSWYEVDQYNMKGSNKPLHATLVLEPGDFAIMTGPNSRDTQETILTVK